MTVTVTATVTVTGTGTVIVTVTMTVTVTVIVTVLVSVHGSQSRKKAYLKGTRGTANLQKEKQHEKNPRKMPRFLWNRF